MRHIRKIKRRFSLKSLKVKKMFARAWCSRLCYFHHSWRPGVMYARGTCNFLFLKNFFSFYMTRDDFLLEKNNFFLPLVLLKEMLVTNE